MTRRTSRNNTYNSGRPPIGIYRATVTAVGSSTVSVKIPRLGLLNIYENLPVIGPMPSVSDEIFVGFIEGKTSNPVAFTSTDANTGDIDSVVAGTALSGGGSSGDVTLNFAPSELSSATVSTSDKIVIADADDSDNPKTVTVQSIVDLSPVGDITGVTAGTALSGGGTSGTVTVNFAPSELSSVTVATDDKVVIADTSDSDNPKHVTAQSIANLAAATPGGSTTQIQYNNSGSFAGSANFTFDGTSTVTLTDTDAGSEAAPIIELYRNSASPADADYIGQIKFQAENDADQKVVYAKLTGKIDDASDTTEDGILEIMLKKAGSNNIAMRFTSTTMKLINSTGIEVNGAAQFDSTVDIAGDTTITNSTGNYTLIGNNANEQLKLTSDNNSGRPFLSFNNQDASGNLDRKGYIGFPEAASDSSAIYIRADQGVIDMGATQMTSLTLSGNADFNGDLDVDGTTNLDVVDIDGAVDMASSLTVGGNVFATAKMATGVSSFTVTPWSNSTIALGAFGGIGTQGSYRTSLSWNWERGTDSQFHHLDINSYPQAGAVEIGNGGILFEFDDDYETTHTTHPAIRARITSAGLILGSGTTGPILSEGSANTLRIESAVTVTY